MFHNKRNLFRSMILCVFSLAACLFAYSQSKKDSMMQDKKEIHTTVAYCNLEVPAFWKQANSNFYLMYTFKVNEKGEAIEVKKIRDDIVGEEKVKQCITEWRISGLPDNADLTVSFKWQHGKGWIEQTISGKGFKQTTSIENVGY